MTLILSVLIIAGIYYLIYKAIRYIFSDLLDVYFSKKQQYEQSKDTKAEMEFYKTAADIENHLKNEQTSTKKTTTKKPFTQADFERWKAAKEKLKDQGGFVDLDELGKLFRRRTV